MQQPDKQQCSCNTPSIADAANREYVVAVFLGRIKKKESMGEEEEYVRILFDIFAIGPFFKN